MVGKVSQNGPKMVPKWCQNGPRMPPEWPKRRPADELKCARCFGSRFAPQSGPKVSEEGPKWSLSPFAPENGAEVLPKESQNGPRKAQKASSGGA